MVVPEVFIEWWAQHASSNTDLANLSNINRQWRRIVIQTLLEQDQKEDNKTLLLLPSMISRILSKESAASTGSTHQQRDEQDTFCAAWFHPAGIQIQQLNVTDHVWEYEGERGEMAFAPGGVPFYGGSEEEVLTGRFGVQTTTTSRGRTPHRQRQEGPLCSHEWQGYRDAIDVLEPFGYAPHFVEVRHVVVVLLSFRVKD